MFHMDGRVMPPCLPPSLPHRDLQYLLLLQVLTVLTQAVRGSETRQTEIRKNHNGSSHVLERLSTV